MFLRTLFDRFGSRRDAAKAAVPSLFERLEERRMFSWHQLSTAGASWSQTPENLQDVTATVTYSSIPAHTHIQADVDFVGDTPFGSGQVTATVAGSAMTLNYSNWEPEWYGSKVIAHTSSSASVSATGTDFTANGETWEIHPPGVYVSYFQPVVNITNGGGSTTEGGSPTSFTLTRDGSSAVWGNSLSVDVSTNTGSADRGDDYEIRDSNGTLVTGALTIPANAGSAVFSVVPLEDDILESTESAFLTLSSNAGYTLGSSIANEVMIAQGFVVIHVDAQAGGTQGWDDANDRLTVTRPNGAVAELRELKITVKNSLGQGMRDITVLTDIEATNVINPPWPAVDGTTNGSGVATLEITVDNNDTIKEHILTLQVKDGLDVVASYTVKINVAQ
jgi:hypothetical protein